MPTILCDADHKYTVDGRPCAGVHEIMDDVLGRPVFGCTPEQLRAAQDFGSAMHDWCVFEDDGGADPAGVPEPLLPRLGAWQEFKRAVEWKTVLRETMVWHPSGYCGRFDFAGSMMFKRVRRDAIIDLKKGRPGDRPRLQTAAYKLALCREMPAFMPIRATLELRENGTFSFEVHEDRADEQKWLTLVAAHYIRKEFVS